MFCGQCGSKLTDGAKFCGNCGTAVKETFSNLVSNNSENIEEEVEKISTSKEKKRNIFEGDIIEFAGFNWRVLNVAKSKSRALLISKNIIKILHFHNSGYHYVHDQINTNYMNEFERFNATLMANASKKISTNDIVWADSYIRTWLNTEFYNLFFDIEEKEQILKTNINTTGKRENHTYGGEDTKDKVFLLSLDELKKYMYQGKDCISLYNGKACSWWLRSPGLDNRMVASVDSTGHIFMEEYHFNKLGVRPCIYIKL